MSQPQDPVGQIGRWLMDFSVAMLTTQDAYDSSLRSRPMAIAGGKFSGDLFFFTRIATAKVEEIQSDQQVNVALADPTTGRYLSLSGIANLVKDPNLLRDRWNESLRVWFPLGLQEPDLAILQVKVISAEYWDKKNRVEPVAVRPG